MCERPLFIMACGSMTIWDDDTGDIV